MARTRDFAQVIRAKLAADPDLAEAVESEAFISNVAMQVYDARMAAGLTQKQLAERIGTKQSVISRIEDADYDGHSVTLLKKIAKALGQKLHVEFCVCVAPSPSQVTESFNLQWQPVEEWHFDFRENTGAEMTESASGS